MNNVDGSWKSFEKPFPAALAAMKIARPFCWLGHLLATRVNVPAPERLNDKI